MEFKKNTIRLVDDNGKVLAEYGNSQTIANRNMLLNFYNGTNPSDFDFVLRVTHESGSTLITSFDDDTNQPTGSNIVAWNYERTATKYPSTQSLGNTSGGIRIRGSIYFPNTETIERIAVEQGTVSFFRKDITESVVGGKNLNIIYDIDI